MNRRGFLKGLFSTTAGGATAVASITASKYNEEKRREAIIAYALETPEGRKALADAMTEPIKKAIEYKAIGRKLLMVDDFPQ